MKNINKRAVAIIAVILVAVGIFWIASSNDTPQTSQNTQSQTQDQVEQKPVVTISEDGKTVSYEGVTGQTALQILKNSTEVETQNSDFGEFVTSIGGLKADSAKEYWSFYVDGAYANEGAGTFQTTDGQKIEWKLESL